MLHFIESLLLLLSSMFFWVTHFLILKFSLEVSRNKLNFYNAYFQLLRIFLWKLISISCMHLINICVWLLLWCWKFQCLLFVLKRSYICYYVLCITVPLSNKLHYLYCSIWWNFVTNLKMLHVCSVITDVSDIFFMHYCFIKVIIYNHFNTFSSYLIFSLFFVKIVNLF